MGRFFVLRSLCGQSHEEHGVVHVKEAGHMEEELDGDSIVICERADRIHL